ncbi:1-acyl-sn-glycerol-3-phosphate acyltransferase [Neisseria sp. HSC-16F19]|nr:lysophospholipid acyltransferase family protein [Neisseria sp. HSC-16F19]MCP2039771.1 1-acyl-sn-glycerol-3-phosphate acyltransferase [Neisseria sp. HSC-16F19]
MSTPTPTPTPLPLCLLRLIRLAGWLLHSWWRVMRLDRLPEERRAAELTDISCRMLGILNVRIRVQRPPNCIRQTPLLIVANHVSWLDIPVLLGTAPGGFIAKQSIRHWPVIGKMAVRAGTVFINRDARSDITPVNQAIAHALNQGHSVVFFPEARTSDGLDVLPFKAALFQAAVDSGTPVQAIALRYHGADGRRCPEAAWVGSTLLRTSIWRVLRQRHIDTHVDFSPLLHPAGHGDRFALKEAAENFIRQVVAPHTEKGG